LNFEDILETDFVIATLNIHMIFCTKQRGSCFFCQIRH